jgi:hypothetical protein
MVAEAWDLRFTRRVESPTRGTCWLHCLEPFNCHSGNARTAACGSGSRTATSNFADSSNWGERSLCSIALMKTRVRANCTLCAFSKAFTRVSNLWMWTALVMPAMATNAANAVMVIDFVFMILVSSSINWLWWNRLNPESRSRLSLGFVRFCLLNHRQIVSGTPTGRICS